MIGGLLFSFNSALIIAQFTSQGVSSQKYIHHAQVFLRGQGSFSLNGVGGLNDYMQFYRFINIWDVEIKEL